MPTLLLAHDGTDKDALDRRKAARQAHLDNAHRLKAEGLLLTAGALLDGEGRMIGSFVLFSPDSKEDVEKIVQADPYVSGGVWKTFDYKPVKVAL